MEYYPTPLGIEQYFSEKTRLASFPPDGIARIIEINYYFLLKRKEKVVGYYVAVDSFNDGIIELHGSYDGPTDFQVRSYFMLSRKFVYTIQKMFPDKTIRTYVLRTNTRILGLLKWINFECIEPDNSNSKYVHYELRDTSMLSPLAKLIHKIYRIN